MSVRVMTWALDQRTGYPTADLVLIRLADAAGGDGGLFGIWSGTMRDLQALTGLDDPRDASWSLWFLEQEGYLRMVGVETREFTLVIGESEPEEVPQRVLERRSKRNYGAGVSKRRRAQVMERDGYACVRCKATEDLTLDHIHPRSKGGKSTEDNLRVLCRPCNSRKGARLE